MSYHYENRTMPLSIDRRHHLGFGAHLHKEIEIVYMLGGESLAYLDSKAYHLHPGDLFISFPNKVHYYETFADEDYLIMIVSPEIFPDYAKTLLNLVPESPMLPAAALPEGIGALLQDALEAYHSEKRYREEITKGYLNVFLGETLPLFTYKDVQNRNTDMLSAILAYCMQNYTDSISLDTMAAALHASKYYISRLFSEKVKISFNDYLNMLRINDAKDRLLKTDDSVTQIGIAVGYNTIRSFNRAFLSQVGLQPRQYRNAYRSVQ